MFHILMLKIMRHHPQSLAHIPDIPLLFAEQPNRCLIIGKGMHFTGQQFEDRRFACAVGTKDRGVHPCCKREGQVIEHAGVTPIDCRLFDVEYGTSLKGG